MIPYVNRTISLIGVFLLLTLVFLQFKYLLPTCISAEVIRPLFSSTLAIISLTTFGWCLQHRLTKTSPSFGPVQLGVGQIFLIILLYLRSLVSANSSNLSFSIFNFNCWDITVVCFGFILYEIRSLNTRQLLYGSIKENYLSLVIIAAAIYLIILRDLPQSVMMSTDPDQHLYFASRILFSGGIPWSQGHIGPNSFNYPAGFASLVAIWVRIGFFDLKSCLAVLPTIQSILAVSICAQIVIPPSCLNKNSSWRCLLIILFIIFSIFTFTNEHRFYHLQGTGRIASWMIVATVIYSAFNRNIFWLSVATFGCVVLAYINPILPIIPGLLVIIRIIWQMISNFSLRIIYLISTIILVSIFLILIDPYYFKILATYTISQSQITDNQAQTLLANISFPNFIPPLLGDWAFAILATLLGVSLMHCLINRDIRNLVIVTALPLLICLAHFISPILYKLSSVAPGGALLIPYFGFSMYQFITLWLIILIALTVKSINDNNLGFFALTSFFLFNFQNINDKRDQIGLINIKPRQEYCECCPIISHDDEKLFAYMQTQYKEYVANNRPTDFKSIPKILIPNAPDFINGEKWIFPIGATRILPLYQTFPLAFFYGQGSDDYSSEIYKKKVCRDLDLRWMAVRNIRYIVLPSKEKGCIRGLNYTDDDIIFRSDNAKLVKLFD